MLDCSDILIIRLLFFLTDTFGSRPLKFHEFVKKKEATKIIYPTELNNLAV